MAKSNEKDRDIYIKDCLAEGETREKIAQRLGYHNWRGLDIFMRRQGMKWDSRKNNYYSMGDAGYLYENSKIQTIISMFDNMEADPKNIATQAGFKNHHEMAAYMKANNYVWSHDISNYIMNSARNDIIAGEITDSGDAGECPGVQDDLDGKTDISKYLPLLDLLMKNKEKLAVLFSEAAPTIPRYTVSGIIRTKSFYMSDRIARLISDYSRSKNISQKEIVEAAIIEFLCKYSYKEEVSKMLDSSDV